MTGNTQSRREFLGRCGWIAAAGAVGGLTIASVRYMRPDVLYEPPKEYKIGTIDDYPEGVDFISDKRIFIVREQNSIRALSGVCTHLGCTVQWIEERNRWECPCHGSVFNDKGAVDKGPARNPLPWFDVNLTQDGILLVDERKIVSYTKSLTVKT